MDGIVLYNMRKVHTLLFLQAIVIVYALQNTILILFAVACKELNQMLFVLYSLLKYRLFPRLIFLKHYFERGVFLLKCI